MVTYLTVQMFLLKFPTDLNHWMAVNIFWIQTSIWALAQIHLSKKIPKLRRSVAWERKIADWKGDFRTFLVIVRMMMKMQEKIGVNCQKRERSSSCPTYLHRWANWLERGGPGLWILQQVWLQGPECQFDFENLPYVAFKFFAGTAGHMTGIFPNLHQK